MNYESINPYTTDLIKSYDFIRDDELENKLQIAVQAYSKWRRTSTAMRKELVESLAAVFKKELEFHSRLISVEMGKPIRQARAENEKCIRLCDYYAQNFASILKSQEVPSHAKRSFISYEPLGIVFAIMPWNFPYWQVFRYLIPNLLLGNTSLLKHASNVPQCAIHLEKLFLDAGFPEGVFMNLFISHQQAEKVIQTPEICGVTLTGSELAGSKIAALAGKYIKKTVLELGGSDPFIVLEDADLELTAKNAVFARMQNTGQSCIASKRFIIMKPVYNEFIELFKREITQQVIGDPLDENTDIGPLARAYLLEELETQVNGSVQMGAEILLGGQRHVAGKWFYSPTVLANIRPGMPAYAEEMFGPVAAVFAVNSADQAVSLANDTDFGLGASVWTQDEEKALKIASEIITGTVSVNGVVKSNPQLPFGGVKKSGFGRELADFGLKEFANIKTINIF